MAPETNPELDDEDEGLLLELPLLDARTTGHGRRATAAAALGGDDDDDDEELPTRATAGAAALDDDDEELPLDG